VINRLVMVATLGAWIALATPAKASVCAGDLWGGRTSAIQSQSMLTVIVISQTNLNHLVGHPYCHGDFYAKSELSGSGANCATGDEKTHHTTLGDGTVAWAQRTCSGLSYDTFYQTRGSHWGFDETAVNSQSDSVYFAAPPPDPQQECEMSGGTWTCDIVCECQWVNCPLILDVAGNGMSLTSASNGVNFDLRPDGIPESLAWTAAYSDDAFIVLDRNGNGRIDDGGELFSNYAPRWPTSPPSGFGALARLDAPSEGGNRDGYISPLDAVYMSLDLWRDINHDGVSQPEELTPLNTAVFAIDLRYRESFRQDPFGNVFRYRSKATTYTRPPSRWVWDVFLVGR
jgi:hypothetical protein